MDEGQLHLDGEDNIVLAVKNSNNSDCVNGGKLREWDRFFFPLLKLVSLNREKTLWGGASYASVRQPANLQRTTS
jgi:hypothetical protein